MTLEQQLVEEIAAEAEKLCQRYHAYHNALHLEHHRKRRRLTGVPPKIVKTPEQWAVDRAFDPFYVNKRRRQIARSIAAKISDGSYAPEPPHRFDVPKPSGGFRSVSVYRIADAAVSRFFYRQLLRKNRHRFSSLAYAYRNDRNAHFAIQDLAIELAQSSRLFIAEFDFSKFFDSISHSYLYAQFDENGFSITEPERNVIRAFLATNESKGIPQGTSISLFLANLVCWRLDRDLERAGLRFARYADDTVIWSSDYARICQAYEIINRFSEAAGVAINAEKSEGISLLCREGMPSELVSRKDKIDFLGYSVSADNVSIKGASVHRLKRQISYTLYKHLIQPLQGVVLRAITIPANDKDVHFLGAMMEIRRYLYGNLTDQMIASYLNGSSSRIFFKGIMSYYPLVNDERQLKGLDGWLVSAIFKVTRKRAALLTKLGFKAWINFPFSLSRKSFASELKNHRIGRRKLLQIPSFFSIYQALRKGISGSGVAGVINPNSTGYDY